MTAMPTQPGDVLILRTVRSFHIHVVGPVVKAGQQDFCGQINTRQTPELTEAIAMASRVLSGGRVFLRNIDTNDWSIVSVMQHPSLQERRTA